MVGHRQDPSDGDSPSLPAPSPRLALAPEQPLAVGVVAAVRAVIAYANQCATTVAAESPRDAIHEFRKSVRRARAVYRLLEDIADPAVVAAAQQVLRSAQLATSAQRDSDVLPNVLCRLPLPPVTGASVALRLFTSEFRRAARLPAKPVLDAHAAAMETLPDDLADGLPNGISWKQLSRGVRSTYRRARRALARSKRDEAQFHRWRKRNKELVYQLELLAIPGAKRASRLRRRHATLSETLGNIVDLMVVRDRLAVFDDAPAHEAVRVVEKAIRVAMRKARKRGKKLYATGPRRFSRQVAKSARVARKSVKTS